MEMLTKKLHIVAVFVLKIHNSLILNIILFLKDNQAKKWFGSFGLSQYDHGIDECVCVWRKKNMGNQFLLFVILVGDFYIKWNHQNIDLHKDIANYTIFCLGNMLFCYLTGLGLECIDQHSGWFNQETELCNF